MTMELRKVKLLCRFCGKDIRWTETMGWVHGALGDIYQIRCDDNENEALPTQEWLDL